MKVGIWLQDGYNPSIGGGFSYYDKFISAVDSLETSEDYKFCYVTMSGNLAGKLNKEVIKISVFPRFLREIKFLGKVFRGLDWIILKHFGDKIAKKHNIGIIVYLTQNVCFTTKIPFISTNWDIGHLSTYPFPELSTDKQFKRRNDFYENILPRALMVLADSEAGKRELLEYTKVGNHKINVMPIFAGNVTNIKPAVEFQLNVLKKYDVRKDKYFIYPAQYWPHKNHHGLINAFKKFSYSFPEYKLLLCGSDKGNKQYIKGIVDRLDLNNKVHFLGFVSNEELATLYLNSTALIMASHFGPTNMPPIEALDMNVPIVCSDISGHKEILENSAVYFDSYDINSIFKALVTIVEHREIYKELLLKRKAESKFTIDNSINSFVQNINHAVIIRKNWSI